MPQCSHVNHLALATPRSVWGVQPRQCFNDFRHAAQGLVLEDVLQWEIDLELLSHFRDKLHREHRVAAQIKKIILSANALEPHESFPERGQSLFDWTRAL